MSIFSEKILRKYSGANYCFFIYCFSGVLVNLHHSQASNGNTGECGLINIDAIQQVVAAKWAVDVINNQSLPHELRIGRSTSTQNYFFPRIAKVLPDKASTFVHSVLCVMDYKSYFLENVTHFSSTAGFDKFSF